MINYVLKKTWPKKESNPIKHDQNNWNQIKPRLTKLTKRKKKLKTTKFDPKQSYWPKAIKQNLNQAQRFGWRPTIRKLFPHLPKIVWPFSDCFDETDFSFLHFLSFFWFSLFHCLPFWLIYLGGRHTLQAKRPGAVALQASSVNPARKQHILNTQSDNTLPTDTDTSQSADLEHDADGAPKFRRP